MKTLSAQAADAPATDAITDPAATPAPETQPAAAADPAATEGEGATAALPEANSNRAEAQRFKAAFGDQGAVWYADGLTFEQAQQKQNSALSDRLAAVETRLNASAAITGEVKPAGFSAGDDSQVRKGLASKIKIK